MPSLTPSTPPSLADRLAILEANDGAPVRVHAVDLALIETVLREAELPHDPATLATVHARLLPAPAPKKPLYAPFRKTWGQRFEEWMGHHALGVKRSLVGGLPVLLLWCMKPADYTLPNLVSLALVTLCLPRIATWLCTPSSLAVSSPQSS